MLLKTLRKLSAYNRSAGFIDPEGVQYWRERIYSYMIGAMLVFGLIVVIPSAWLSFSVGYTGLGIFDIFAYLAIVAIFFLRRLPYIIRAVFLMLISLAVGIVVFIITGDEGAGFFWIFAVPPLASLLLGLRWGTIFLLLNTLIVAAFGVLVATNSPAAPRILEFTLEGWIVYGLNFLITNAIVTLPLGALLNGLLHSSAESGKRKAFSDSVIQTANVIFVQLDTKGVLVKINQAGEEITGYRSSEIEGQNWREKLVPKEKFPHAWDEFDRYAEKGELLQNFENPILTKSGQERQVLWQNSVLRDEGVVVGTISFGVDVTEKRENEEKLRLSDEIIQRVQALVLVINEDGEMVFVGPASEKILGYLPEELLGDTWWDLTRQSPAEADEERKTLRQVARGEIAISNEPYERQIWTRSGEPRWVEWQDAMGPDHTVIGVGQDITERKLAEDAIQLNSEKLDESLRFRQLIIASFSVGILAYEAKSGKCVLANEAAAEILGATQDQLLSQNFLQLESWKTSGHLEHALKTIRTGTEQKFESNFITTFGKEVHLSCIFNPFDLEGKQHLLLTIDDISERKRDEQEILYRMAELEAIRDISVNLRSALTLDEILPVVLDTTLQVLDLTVGSIWLYDKSSDMVHVAISRGYANREGKEVVIPPEKPGEGLAGAVFGTGEIHLSREYQSDLRLPKAVRERVPPGIGGATLPIRAGSEIIGVFSLNTSLPREIGPGELSLLGTLAEIVGNSIQRSELTRKTDQQLTQFKVLSEIDRVILSSFDLEFNLNMLLINVVEQLDVSAANIMLYDPKMETLTALEGVGFRTASFRGQQVQMGEGHAGQAALERIAVHVENLDQKTDNPRLANALTGEDFTTYYGLPLVAKGELRGVLEIFNRGPLLLAEDWLGVAKALAGRAAIAIDTLKVFDNLQRSNEELVLSYDAAIEGWSRALDLRDEETEGHTLRVTELTLKLAERMGIADHELVHMRRGALLHDIGKMGIPDSILLKPGKLTEEEWKKMKMHPVYAREMLGSIQYLQDAMDIPFSHHEKWDGGGYPRGIAGTSIPLIARIFAIVDVYDALTSNRPYRKAWPKDKAVAYIREQAGKHFDPDVAKAFLELDLP